MPKFYLKPDDKLFDEVALEWAKAIYGDKKDPLTNKNQIRNFYDKILEFYDKVYVQKEEFEDVRPFLKMLKSKIEYAKGRKVAKGAFVEFIKKGVDSIQTKEDLKNYKLLFEAVIGFFIGIEYDKKNAKGSK